jgi:hypothetical protein
MEISNEKLYNVKKLIYTEGRLLERKLFQYFFENGSKEGCIKALIAYQNEDGGFGNGIEPDLSTPSSSGIGVETALYILDILDYPHDGIIEGIINWLIHNLNDTGYLHYPPSDLIEYPYQPWWANEDAHRVFSIAGLLAKLGFKDERFDETVNKYAMKSQVASEINVYDYPLFIYALYNEDFKRRNDVLEYYIRDFTGFLTRNIEHNPLLGRYWNYAIPLMSDETVSIHANLFINNIQDDGAFKNPYPELPCWRPIMTLDGLMILKKYNLI